MEMIMIRAKIDEDRNQTVTHFLNWLNKKIANVVDLHPYVELEDMYHMTLKVEQQINGRTFKSHVTTTTSNWKSKWKESEKSTSKPKFEKKGKEGRSSKQAEVLKLKTRSIKCFKYKERGHM